MVRRGIIAGGLIAGVFVLALGARVPQARAADAASEARYQALLAGAKAGQPVDWRALRFAYADSTEFDLSGTGAEDTRKAMYAALSSGDFKGALAKAQALIDADYVNIEAHLAADRAYHGLGQADAAAREQAIAVGLLKSIQTGDGKSPATAFTPITVAEEYVLMGARGRKVVRQALISRDGHSYDALDTVKDGGDPRTFYFQIDKVLAAEAAAFMK
jgi:hypothetical protein